MGCGDAARVGLRRIHAAGPGLCVERSLFVGGASSRLRRPHCVLALVEGVAQRVQRRISLSYLPKSHKIRAGATDGGFLGASMGVLRSTQSSDPGWLAGVTAAYWHPCATTTIPSRRREDLRDEGGIFRTQRRGCSRL